MEYREPARSSPARSAGAAAGKALKSASRAVSKSASRKKESIKQPSRRRSSTSSRSSSSSRSSGSRSSGSSSRSRSSGRSSGGGGGVSRSVAPKRPSVPSLASFLGNDSAYLQSVRGSKRSLSDFISEIGRRRGEANTQFTQTKGSMERDRVQQLKDLEAEFASRGLIQSGLYGEEQGRFQQQFSEQMNTLGQQQAALLADLMSQQKNYQRENSLGMEQARQEALQRRAAKYKIGA